MRTKLDALRRHLEGLLQDVLDWLRTLDYSLTFSVPKPIAADTGS